MSSMTFGQKSFQTRPPDKGSFPLDHEGKLTFVDLQYIWCYRIISPTNPLRTVLLYTGGHKDKRSQR